MSDLDASKKIVERVKLIDIATRRHMVQISDELRATAGRQITLALRDHPDLVEEQINQLTVDEKEAVFERTIGQLLNVFADFIGDEALNRLISVRGGTPAEARDSVTSWVKAIDPLVKRAKHKSFPCYYPNDFVDCISSVQDDVLRDALWSPNSVRSGVDLRHKVYDALFPYSLYKALSNLEFDKELIKSTISKYHVEPWDTLYRRARKLEQSCTNGDVAIVIEQQVASIPPFLRWELAETFIYVAGEAHRRRQGASKTRPYQAAAEYEIFVTELEDRSTEAQPQRESGL